MRIGRTLSALLLCTALSLSLLSAVLAADQPAPPSGPPGDGVTIEAEGLAPIPAGKALSDARREALLDARRNAVIQAHVVVQTRERVQGMRLQESLVRSEALGYVEQMQVWEEGRVDGSQPAFYRVRVHALVRPLSSFSAQAALGQSRRDPYQPVVTLKIEGEPPGVDMAGVRATLADALHHCGVAVRAPGAGPALALSMSVTAGPQATGRSVVADWELSAGPDAAGPGEVAPAGLYVGHWQVGASEEGAESWRHVGLMIAQDAIRLWATPRWTTVRFLGPTRAQADALSQSFGRAPDARMTRAEDLSALTVGLPVAGDPVVAVTAFVQQAGLSNQVERGASSSLTDLTYRCLPAPRAAERERGM